MKLLLSSSLSLFLLAVVSHVATSSTDVRQPPAITASPASHVIYRSGQEIKLPCAASGTPTPTYEWLKNGDPVNLNAHNIRRHGAGDMLITEATIMDEGYYQCVANNMFGKDISNGTFLQRASLTTLEATPSMVTEMEVVEGQPFFIPLTPLKSSPTAQYRWAMADDVVTMNQRQTELMQTKRMQWAVNGDLYFAYATRDDSINGMIYKGITFNPYVDLSAGGSYTRVTVRPVPGGLQAFAPTLAFSSPNETVGLEGNGISLHCFFNGYPEAAIAWIGPNDRLPIGRYERGSLNTELKLRILVQSDTGTYVCDGSNWKGSKKHRIHLTVDAVPVFKHPTDQPQNANVTDGDSMTFHCNPYARPSADITWMINGSPLDIAGGLPSRISISADRHSLTVRSICRDCQDRPDSLSDLMVIQCNASNKHGYAFGSGYLNVLKKTTVSLVGDTLVTIDDNRKRSLEFQCIGTSDPSTPVRHTWYEIADDDTQSLVYHSPPGVVIDDGMLTITAGENTTVHWGRRRGRYQCVADNGYSKANVMIRIEVFEAEPLEELHTAGIMDYWWIFVIIVCVFLLFILLLICCICIFRHRGDKYDVDCKERKNGNNPEKELMDSGFHDYQRREVEPFKGSQNSLGSSARLFGDDASEVGEHSKFLENGSFHSNPYTNTVDRMRGRSEIV